MGKGSKISQKTVIYMYFPYDGILMVVQIPPSLEASFDFSSWPSYHEKVTVAFS